MRPASLWLLLAAQAKAHERRNEPTAVRKMPADQGAKFHHEYCAFDDSHQEMPQGIFASEPIPNTPPPPAALAARSTHDTDDARRLWANSSAELAVRAPFGVLLGSYEQQMEEEKNWNILRRAASALSHLNQRQWACPSGTTSCAAIGFPHSCCGRDEMCMAVDDTGLGPVGCCPAGATCSGGISGCAGGSTACDSQVGGGCCIPGWVCQGVGCVQPAPSPPPAPTTLTTTSTSIISAPQGTPSTILVTVIITITPSSTSTPHPITSTITHTTTASPSHSASSSESQEPSSSSGEAGAPWRPTSSAAQPTNPAYCPTGFYPCLARAGGGCCQTGRDCATASCPAPGPMTTIVGGNGNGVTVVVPVPEGGQETQGACANGWFLCDGRDGNGDGNGESDRGCCPQGYECGTASCFARPTEKGVPSASVAKGMPGNSGGGMVRVRVGGVIGMGIVMGLGLAL
ncbi:hypothetical protein B0J18DRAFT_423117 [Chaetomium sp. MPI-SDFR-AT-0129]|nr:hypothetical protein B0J18DRAFT_423117 [Chaetomium sp. MPI-SDFR-AT-0129]